MKLSYTSFLAVLASIGVASADCINDGGNYYCSETSKVVYRNVGFGGSYQDVTNMDEDSGKCSQQSKSFSGNLSPLDEELSVHFRGPLKLLEFGVYYPSSGNDNKKRDDDCSTHVHHHHKRATAVVEITQTIIVDAQGNTQAQRQVVTTTLGGDKAVETSTAPISSALNSAPSSAQGGSSASTSANSHSQASSAADTSASSSSDSSDSSSSAAAGDYTRVASYTPGSADNVTFLNYYGGSGSGVWSLSFGNSLSYANSDASGGSSSPVALDETTIDSNVEYVIMSGSKCGDNDCGYYRSGIPAYHGFGGPDKIFVFEFEMPTATDSASFNNDMPAIWLLNAKIPRTLQYGKETCSCWKTGCGELDLFEILASGSDKLICHLHDGQGNNGSAQGGGGSQNYFKRPTSGSMKAAVIFTHDEIHVMKVNSDFGSTLDASTVKKWIGSLGSEVALKK